MNLLTIIGNLTRDPELRSVNTANGPVSVCTFTVAVNKRNSDQADFFRVSCWRGLAETCSKYLAKGRKVAVTGSVSCSTYTDQSGTARANLEVDASQVDFLSPKGEAPTGTTPASDDFKKVEEPEDLPF